MNNICSKCGAKKKVLFTSWYCDCDTTNKGTAKQDITTPTPYVPLKGNPYPYGPYSSNLPTQPYDDTDDTECASCGSSSCVCYSKVVSVAGVYTIYKTLHSIGLKQKDYDGNYYGCWAKVTNGLIYSDQEVVNKLGHHCLRLTEGVVPKPVTI